MSAFGDLYDRWWAHVVREASGVLGSEPDAEDVAGRVFFRLWRNGGWWRIEQPSRFFRDAARNEALNELRRRRPGRVQLDQAVARLLASPDPDPCSQLLRRQLRERLERVLDDLPPRCALVSRLVFLEGRSHREAAELTGVSVRAVTKQVARARRLVASQGSYSEYLSHFVDGGGRRLLVSRMVRRA